MLPLEAHRPVVTYLQFPIQVCFSILSVCRPRQASHAHSRHRYPYGVNSSIDAVVACMTVSTREFCYHSTAKIKLLLCVVEFKTSLKYSIAKNQFRS